jgi:hypothetical protein
MRNFSAAALADLREHSKERPFDYGADVLPDEWTADHLSEKLVEALKVERRMPKPKGPRQPGNHGLTYVHSDLDRKGWENTQGVSEEVAALGDPFEERKRDINRTNLHPSKDEIGKMEQCFCFLRWFGVEDGMGAVILLKWAAATAGGRSITKTAAAIGVPKRTFYSKRESGLKACAAMLNRMNEPVF